MQFSIFQDTHIGARSSNQDRMGYCFTRECLLMVLADGMGGHLRGEIAAELSVQAAAEMFQQAAQPRLQDPAEFLEQAFQAGHRQLHGYRATHLLAESPHTTLVACVIQDNHAWWAHAGDSRLYLVRGGVLAARTTDHSKVEALVRMGQITREQADTHPERNKVLNCLGSFMEPMVEIQARFALRPRDAILLCSDGFWSGVDEAAMAQALDHEPVKELVPRLIRQALTHQGSTADNTTALALQWDAGFGDDAASTAASRLPGQAEGILTTTIALGIDREPVPQHHQYPSHDS